jgi:hypothetical protein
MDLDDGVVPEELDLGVGERTVLHDLRGAQLVAAVHDRDLLGELGQERRFLDRRVATPDDGDVLAAEEEPVARRARRQTVADEALLVLEPEHQRRAPVHDDRSGPVLGVADPDAERALEDRPG